MTIKTMSFGCRLNALETEKIKNMLVPALNSAIIVNTCAVTAAAEKQSCQAIRRFARENENVPIFITGCVATRNPAVFANISNAIIIKNADKLNLDAYLSAYAKSVCYQTGAQIQKFNNAPPVLSKQFIQVQNGCNHNCSYCITRALRGKNVAFSYTEILAEARKATADGFFEIILTGIDIASYINTEPNQPKFLSDLCRQLLQDVPEIERLRLSSLDPASPDIFNIIALIKENTRMMPHLHLSVQSGSSEIAKAMRRRHNANDLRKIMARDDDFEVSFSWDIICGFPGETDELFLETAALARELKPIKIHAFPFSARPETDAFDMPNQINKSVSKSRVKIITQIADENKKQFMQSRLGTIASVLMEQNNIARTPDDIEVFLSGKEIEHKTICNLKLCQISDLHFTGKVC